MKNFRDTYIYFSHIYIKGYLDRFEIYLVKWRMHFKHEILTCWRLISILDVWSLQLGYYVYRPQRKIKKIPLNQNIFNILPVEDSRDLNSLIR